MQYDIKNDNVGLGLKLVPISAPREFGETNVYAVRSSLGRQSSAGPALYRNESLQQSVEDKLCDPSADLLIVFQEGSPHTHGVNGATIEAYLLACARRLDQYQSNDMTACDENLIALNKIKEALQALSSRHARISAENDRLDDEEEDRQAREEEEEDRSDHQFR